MAGFNRPQFEAIAAFERNDTPDIKAVLIVEPQFSAVALCTFDDGGKAEAYRVWEDGTTDILADSKLDVKGLGARVKGAVKSYYLTGKAMDNVITVKLNLLPFKWKFALASVATAAGSFLSRNDRATMYAYDANTEQNIKEMSENESESAQRDHSTTDVPMSVRSPLSSL